MLRRKPPSAHAGSGLTVAPIRSTAVEATQETQNRMRTPGGNGLQLGVPGVHQSVVIVALVCPTSRRTTPPLGATAPARWRGAA